MKNLTDLMLIIGTFLTSLISLIALWNITRSVLTFLANIQRKIAILRSLFISLRAESRAMQEFLKTHHGYHIRKDIQDVQEDLMEQYQNDDTGF
ncbi:MAG: hypothetical protein WCD53_29920 [Microcoleus sp.]